MRISFFQRAFALPFLAALAFAGCDADRMGSGTWAEEQRSVHTFDRIEANGAIDLFIEVIDGIETSVIVNSDDNLLGDVATQQNGKTLQIDVDGWLHPTTRSWSGCRSPTCARSKSTAQRESSPGASPASA